IADDEGGMRLAGGSEVGLDAEMDLERAALEPAAAARGEPGIEGPRGPPPPAGIASCTWSRARIVIDNPASWQARRKGFFSTVPWGDRGRQARPRTNEGGAGWERNERTRDLCRGCRWRWRWPSPPRRRPAPTRRRRSGGGWSRTSGR